MGGMKEYDAYDKILRTTESHQQVLRILTTESVIDVGERRMRGMAVAVL